MGGLISTTACGQLTLKQSPVLAAAYLKPIKCVTLWKLTHLPGAESMLVCKTFAAPLREQQTELGGRHLTKSNTPAQSAYEANGLRNAKFSVSTRAKPTVNIFWSSCEPSTKLLQVYALHHSHAVSLTNVVAAMA